MVRIIDADALLDAMEEEIHFTAINASEQARVNNLFCDITDVINESPTIDAEPVRHGKWIPWKYHNGFRCDKCNEPVDNKHNYCPNCGAKMDAEREEE